MNVLRRVVLRGPKAFAVNGQVTAQNIYVRKEFQLPHPGEQIQLVREGDQHFYLGEVTRVNPEAHTYDIRAVIA